MILVSRSCVPVLPLAVIFLTCLLFLLHTNLLLVPKKQSKATYLTSITRNTNSTDKPEVDGALILIPVSISTPFYGNLKLLKLLRTERSRSEDVRSEERTWDLLHKERALTDCAILLLSIPFFFLLLSDIFQSGSWTSDEIEDCSVHSNHIQGN